MSPIGASLAIPPLMKGKDQQSLIEMEQARGLFCARIHIERAIRQIKNYKFYKIFLIKRPCTCVATIDMRIDHAHA